MKQLKFYQYKYIRTFLLLLVFSMPFLAGGWSSAEDTGVSNKSSQGVVATAHPLATAAGVEMLQKGGNAIDAAVAAAFAIGVVEPDGSGIGGGGGMVIRLAKENKVIFINYYQSASWSIDQLNYNFVEDRKSAKAILVPGTVAGLTKAHELYGSLPLSEILAPAVRYAEEGFEIDATLGSLILDNTEDLSRYSSTAAIYTSEGFPRMEGELLVQKDLGYTLRKISEKGRDGFYKGEIAETMVREIREAGGMLTMEDLERYDARVEPAVKGTYRGYDIYAAGLPQSGASIIQSLNMLEFRNLASLGHYSVSTESAHFLAEIFRRVYADRTAYMADPRYSFTPLLGLISKDYARTRYLDIDMNASNPPEYRKTKEGNPVPYNTGSKTTNNDIPPVTNDGKVFTDDPDDEGTSQRDGWGDDQFDSWGKKKKGNQKKDNKKNTKKETDSTSKDLDTEYDGHTTHLSVIDREGNMVSLTQTLGTFFGSFFTTAGVLYNSSMSNYSETMKLNSVEPGKQPRSSISPLIVLKDNKPFLIAGSPGAGRIITTVVQLVSNVIDFKMDAEAANDAPRLFLQKNDDFLRMEKRFTEEVKEGLKQKGHKLRIYGDYDLFFGGASLITIDPVTGVATGSADPRRGGNAIGL
ncbi:MAG: gamma-glutamyltransferase family protein [Ignavibacteriales bacterium]|nr:MAG: gamma-glutamyltransferase family protein [Ignavibacteriales bacterium]